MSYNFPYTVCIKARLKEHTGKECYYAKRKYVKRSASSTNDNKLESTFLERVNARLRLEGEERQFRLRWNPQAIMIAKIYLEHVVSDVLFRTLKKEAEPLHNSLLSFFLSWNRHTGTAPTLNMSMLVKRFVHNVPTV